MAAEVAAEIGVVGESQCVGDGRHGIRGVSEEDAGIEHYGLVDPLRGCLAAHKCHGLAEVLGCHTEEVGIVGDGLSGMGRMSPYLFVLA